MAAPSADAAGLRKVVEAARDRGLDLKVVVMENSPPIDTPLRLGAPAEQVHLRRAVLQRHRRIVEGRGARAEHRHHLPAQRLEVDQAEHGGEVRHEPPRAIAGV